ncbi:hypothetical protein [Halocatena halophila]|uniref:hypothetical protein n=1 Tax=Halocatena halophila TaxID=2814576 RepID=UPI002ED13594
MQRQLHEHGAETRLIPIVQGVEPEERAVCYEVFDRAGFDDYCAFYGTQYFTAGAGIRIDELVADLQEIDTEQDRNIFLIGLLSPNYLERVPDSVGAAAGQTAWRSDMAPTKQSEEELRQQWDIFTNRAVDALGVDPDSPVNGETTNTEMI